MIKSTDYNSQEALCLYHNAPEVTMYKLGMLIENRKSSFRLENRNPFFGFENWFSNLFLKINFLVKNFIMLERYS